MSTRLCENSLRTTRSATIFPTPSSRSSVGVAWDDTCRRCCLPHYVTDRELEPFPMNVSAGPKGPSLHVAVQYYDLRLTVVSICSSTSGLEKPAALTCSDKRFHEVRGPSPPAPLPPLLREPFSLNEVMQRRSRRLLVRSIVCQVNPVYDSHSTPNRPLSGSLQVFWTFHTFDNATNIKPIWLPTV